MIEPVCDAGVAVCKPIANTPETALASQLEPIAPIPQTPPYEPDDWQDAWRQRLESLAAGCVVRAIALGHQDGGNPVRRLYGHRDKGRALDRIAGAYATRAENRPKRPGSSSGALHTPTQESLF